MPVLPPGLFPCRVDIERRFGENARALWGGEITKAVGGVGGAMHPWIPRSKTGPLIPGESPVAARTYNV